MPFSIWRNEGFDCGGRMQSHNVWEGKQLFLSHIHPFLPPTHTHALSPALLFSFPHSSPLSLCLGLFSLSHPSISSSFSHTLSLQSSSSSPIFPFYTSLSLKCPSLTHPSMFISHSRSFHRSFLPLPFLHLSISPIFQPPFSLIPPSLHPTRAFVPAVSSSLSPSTSLSFRFPA